MNAGNIRTPNEGRNLRNEKPANLGAIPEVLLDDSPLLELGKQFTALMSELLVLEREYKERVDSRSTAVDERHSEHVRSNEEIATQRIESVLSRLEEIERKIMLTSAHTIEGLGVKARHAAYVASESWNAPIDQIDWDAQAVRLLIDAVCENAGVSLPSWCSRR
jgi:hypothetical protein